MMTTLKQAIKRAYKHVSLDGQDSWQGPYERRAVILAVEAARLLREAKTEKQLQEANSLTALAQVYATLNVSDELTQFINAKGGK